MKQIISTFVFIFFITFSFSQLLGKKKKIEELTFKVDSLNTVIENDRKINSQKEEQLKLTISELEKEVEKLNTTLLKKEKEILECLNSAKNLLKNANEDKDAQNYESALFIYDEIIQSYPTSEEAIIAKQYKAEINNILVEAEKQKLKEDSEKYIVKSKDPFKERTFYSDKRGDKYYMYNRFSLYFSVKDNEDKPENLRFIFGYKGDDWLFIDKISFLIKDGEKFTVHGDFKRDNNSETVYEWTDVPVNSSLKKFLNAISERKNVLIRFHGDTYSKDFMMNRSQMEGVLNILNLYKEMGGDI